MASSPPPAPLLLLLLLLVAIAAAQQNQPQPQPPSQPQPQSGNRTNADDAKYLSAVFQRWGLEPAAPAEDPCGKQVWFQSFDKTASIDCDCNNSTGECRVTHLNVTGYRNITGIPRELFNLTELVSLDLSNNNLSGSISPDIKNLSKLETWHFNNNQLHGPFPNESSSLRNLQSLWMFDNYINGSLPGFIANFTNLTDLRIYGLKLRGPIPKQFFNLTNLKVLMLGDLDGGNSPFDFVTNWKNLSILSLRKCGIIGQLPSSLFGLPNLRYLDLRSNNISGSVGGLLRQYKNLNYLSVGENNFSGPLPSQNDQLSLALDISYNPRLSGSLPNNQNWSINYIGTSIDVSGTVNSENLLLNCLHKECNRKYYTNNITSLAINCGGKQKKYGEDPLSVTFDDDTSDLGAAGFHVNTDRQWVLSHVDSDLLSNSSDIVTTSLDILGTDMPYLYQTARTSKGDLWYYAVGLSNGNYTVQLFFAEIVLKNEINNTAGRRLFNIDIQDHNITTDFDIVKEAGGYARATNITHEVTVDNAVLKIHLYWNGRGTCCIPYPGAYGPLVSAIRVFRPEKSSSSPPPPQPNSSRHDEKRRGVVAGIAALCIAATVISSSVVYLWWKWVSLVKHPNA